MRDEDAGCFFAHPYSPLFHGGEHGVAGLGAVAVGEATDGYVFGYPEAHALGGVEYAHGRIIVHGEEGIGGILLSQQLWGNQLSVGSVVADAYKALVSLQSVFGDGVAVAVVPVFGNLHGHQRAVVGNAAATGLYEVRDGVERTRVVVHHHSTAFHARANAVVKHKWHAVVQQILEMLVAYGILGL